MTREVSMGDGRFRVACVQHCAGLDAAANLATLARLIEQAVARGAELVCLPEYCAAYGMTDGRLAVDARAEGEHEALRTLGEQARRHGRWLLIGSLGVLAADGRILNRSYLVDPAGAIRARYDKIHLFDVDLARGESYRESSTIRPGETAPVVATPFARLGLTICYDLRFPQLYRALAKAGADVLFVPAAFTRTTGQAHWHVLLRARAIETGAFVVAPSQCGEAPDGSLARYGHSLFVDPWGEVLADGGEDEGVIAAELDLARVAEARRMIPALRHDRVFEVHQVGEG
jgi:deaminated glutathione amidase